MKCALDLIHFSLSRCGMQVSQGTVLITYAKQKFFQLMMPSVIWYAKRNEQEAKMVCTTIIFAENKIK